MTRDMKKPIVPMSPTPARAVSAPPVRAFTALLRTEARLFLREPVDSFFGVLFPAVLLLLLGSAMPGFNSPEADLGGRRPIDIYLPIALAMAIATITMVTLLGGLAGYRESGALRRLSTTPVPPTALLAAQLAVNGAALATGSALAYLAAWLAFGVAAPANLAGALLAFVLGALAMGTLALLIAAGVRASSAIGTLVYFPMMFVAGVWTPGPAMPDPVRRIADWTPLGAASQAMQAAWSGDRLQPPHLVVMAVLTLVFGTLAGRIFRWE